jgi:hypothetical protein
MITLRCTQKLLRRAGVPAKVDTKAPTTVLDDWYANLIYAKPQQLALCMNERSLLVVVLPARDFKNVAPRFRAQAVSPLTRIGVPAAAVAAEEEAMRDFRFGPAANRRILGCLNEAAFALSYELDNPRVLSIAEIEDRFSDFTRLPSTSGRASWRWSCFPRAAWRRGQRFAGFIDVRYGALGLKACWPRGTE